MLDVDRMAEARHELSLARTALDDPAGIWNEEGRPLSDGTTFDPDDPGDRNLYAIDRIDEAMALLAPA